MKKTTRQLKKTKTETKDEHWTFEMRQTLWTMWMTGKAWSTIRKELGKSQRAVESERWKINVQYYDDNPLSIAGTEQAAIRGPDKAGKRWDARDLVTVRIVKSHSRQHRYTISFPRLAILLGRTEQEVRDQLNPRRKLSPFFD